MEAFLQILSFIFLIFHLQALLWGPLDVGLCLGINDKFVVSNLCPPFPEFPNQEVYFLLIILLCQQWIVGSFLTGHLSLHALHLMNGVYEGEVTHMQGREILSDQFGYPTIQLIFMISDESSLIEVEGMEDLRIMPHICRNFGASPEALSWSGEIKHPSDSTPQTLTHCRCTAGL